MKKFLIFLVVAVLAIAAGGYYFVFAKKDVCKNVIPEDAKAVMVFDSKEAVKQLDFSIKDIIDLLMNRGDEKEDLGIDYLSPMYGFVSSDNYLCGVLALNDAEAFEKSLKQTAESQRGFKWVHTNDILACFDSKKALVMGPISKGESDGMRGKMVEWMNQGSHKVPMLSAIQDKDDVLCLRTNLGAMPDTYKSQFKVLNKDVNFDNVFFNASFNIKEKSFRISTEMESKDEEYNKIVSDWNNYYRPIQGDQLQTPYENPLAMVVFNMDGESLYKKLSGNSTWGMLLTGMNLYCNAGKMLEAIDGNVTVAIDDIVEGSPKFYFNAHVKNKDFMKGAKDWGTGLATLGFQSQQIEGDNYMLSNSDSKVFLGVRDEMLYFASDYDAAKAGDKFVALKDGSSLKSQAEGKISFFSIDIDKLKNSSFAKSALNGKDETVKEFLNYLDRLNVSIGKNKSAEIELTTKQKISDIIKMNLKK